MSGKLSLIISFVLASVLTINAASAGLRDGVPAGSLSAEEILQVMEAGPKTQVSNETPQDVAENIYTDTVLCFRPPENALCMDPVADPNLKGPFMFDVYFSSDPCELVWTPPTIGPIDANEESCLSPCTNRLLPSTDYYWRVDITDLNEPGDPCFYQGPVFSFTTRGSCEGWGYVYGDMDGDCFVDFVDYALFAPAWGAQEGDDEYDPNCDINLLIPDGSIDEYDLAILANQWLMQTGPAPPSELTFGIVTPDSIELSWTDNSTVEDGFKIYINTMTGHPRTPSYINDKDDTTLTVTGLQEGTTYYFWIHSYNSYGKSPAISGSKTAMLPPGGPLIEAGKFLYRQDLSLNPALRPGSSGEWDENVVESGDMVKIGDTYYWYFHGYRDTYQIGVATATNPSGPWTKYAGNPIIEVGPGAYDDGYVACAAFYEEAGTYYLFYSSAGISAYDNAIAVATATDPLGPWTKSPSNPILDDESGLGFAAGMIYMCGVVKVGGTYYLYVTDADYTQCDFGPMYVFKSNSIYGPWTRHPDPVLSPGASGEWDDGAFSEAEVFYYEGMFHTFYGGAQMEPGNEECDAPGNTRDQVKESIGYAYSYDGINFTKYEENPVIDRMDIEHDPHVNALAEVHFQIELPYIYIVSTERWEEDWAGHTGCPWCEDLAIQVIEVNEAGWVQIMSDNFESGWGNWTDGGADAIRYTSGTYAHEGSCAINLQDDTSTSVMTTDDIALSDHTAVKVDFWYYPLSFNSSDEDFWLQISTDGGSNYTTVAEWNFDDEFVNDNFYHDSFSITGHTLTDVTRIRFRCDASGDVDDVYIDEVVISAFGGGSVYPLSDLGNTGNWVLRTDLSDEFDGTSLDTNKWFASGTGGVFELSWPGRAPSQFAPENVSVANGKLRLATKWDPDYDFTTENDPDSDYDYGDPPITTAAVITKNTLTHGYMEIRCKPCDECLSSSFWITGDVMAELDVFEFVGDAKGADVDKLWEVCLYCDSDWMGSYDLPWRTASDFHIYGCEYDDTGMRLYADGEVYDDVGTGIVNNWCLGQPLNIWVDNEAFYWYGLPTESELPVYYEIDYIRVWQH